MTVDEVIEKLKELSAQGRGALDVRCFSETGSRYDGYEPIASVELAHSGSSGDYVRLE